MQDSGNPWIKLRPRVPVATKSLMQLSDCPDLPHGGATTPLTAKLAKGIPKERKETRIDRYHLTLFGLKEQAKSRSGP